MELKDSGTEELRSPDCSSLVSTLPILLKAEIGSPNNFRSDFVRAVAGYSGASLNSNASSKTSLRGSRKSPSPPANDARLSVVVKDLWGIVRKVRAKKQLRKEPVWYGASDRSIVVRERLATATVSKAVDVGEAVDGMEINAKEDDVLAERLALIKKEKEEYWMKKREELRSQNWSPPRASGLQNSAPVVKFRKAGAGVTEVKLPDGQRLYRDYAGLGVARDTNNVREFRDDTPIQDRTSRESTRTSRTYTNRSDRESTANSRGSVIHSSSAPAIVEMIATHAPHRPLECEKPKSRSRPASPRRRVAVVQLARFTPSVASEVKIVTLQPGTIAQITVA